MIFDLIIIGSLFVMGVFFTLALCAAAARADRRTEGGK
jgi:hypothetical protein